MDIYYIILAMNLLKIGIIILIIYGIFKGIKGLKKFIIRNKEMEELKDENERLREQLEKLKSVK